MIDPKQFRALRLKKHLPLRIVAEEAGVSISMVCRIERGEYQDSDSAKRISSALHRLETHCMFCHRYLSECGCM